MSDFRRAIADFHRVSADRIEVFEDDAELYEARRAARLRAEGNHRRAARKPPFRMWWAQATPLERFGRIWWWAVCFLVGSLFGMTAFMLACALFGWW
jgi:hypothetical protein